LDAASIGRLAGELQAPLLALEKAVRLVPVEIPKPWGKEVWYTGIEARGQSQVADDRFKMPLPWLLALSPTMLLNNGGRQVNLLKILDPLPEEVFGDLYFELHEEKQEVYVVTHVDAGAWPNGKGAIRFGFDQSVRKEYDSDQAFRNAYLNAVAAYGEVRREIDRQLDQFRIEENVELNAPVSAAMLKRWLQRVPHALNDREVACREAMNRYTAMLPLQVGDVVKVPCLTPHALQHGVRTIEFQTPVYERKILSFAQKVLTQGHWDTEDAARLMTIGAPEMPPLAVLEDRPGLLREQVVQFDDFVVERVTLGAGEAWRPALLDRYRLVIGVAGQVTISGLCLDPEQAVLIPACASATQFTTGADGKAVFLLAEPI